MNHQGTTGIASASRAAATPVVGEPRKPGTATATPCTAAHRRRVLVVDDNPILCELMRHAFEPQGHRVRCAASVQEAVAALDREPFDAVVCDLHLADGCGLSVVAHARAQGRHARIPIVVCTVEVGPEVRSDARAAGADAFLTKPARAADLRGTVERLWLC